MNSSYYPNIPWPSLLSSRWLIGVVHQKTKILLIHATLSEYGIGLALKTQGRKRASGN